MLATGADDVRSAPAEGYFGNLREAWTAACDARGAVDHDLLIGGWRVRLRFAGDALVPSLFPALAHLPEGGGAGPDLTIGVWDTHSTGVELPAPPFGLADAATNRLIPGMNDERFRTHWDMGIGGLTMFDSQDETCIFWVESPGHVPWYLVAAPLRTAFTLALADANRRLVHGGAVGLPGGPGVLLGGRGGSGKTTLSLASLEAGLDFAGDDYVIASIGDRGPAAHCLYSSGKAERRTVEMLPSLAETIVIDFDDEENKAVLDLLSHRGERLRQDLPLTAVVLPRISGAARPRLERVSGAQALRALAPSTMLQLPRVAADSAAELRTITRLVSRLPCYTLEQSRDLQAGVDVLTELLEERAAA